MANELGFLSLGDGYLTELLRQIMVLNFFKCDVKNLFSILPFSVFLYDLNGKLVFNFAICSFFLYDLFTNNARKLKVAESNPIMENIPISLSLSVSCQLGFLSVSCSFYLSRFIYFLADASLQLLLYGVMLSSPILLNN